MVHGRKVSVSYCGYSSDIGNGETFMTDQILAERVLLCSTGIDAHVWDCWHRTAITDRIKKWATILSRIRPMCSRQGQGKCSLFSRCFKDKDKSSRTHDHWNEELPSEIFCSRESIWASFCWRSANSPRPVKSTRNSAMIESTICWHCIIALQLTQLSQGGFCPPKSRIKIWLKFPPNLYSFPFLLFHPTPFPYPLSPFLHYFLQVSLTPPPLSLLPFTFHLSSSFPSLLPLPRGHAPLVLSFQN